MFTCQLILALFCIISYQLTVLVFHPRDCILKFSNNYINTVNSLLMDTLNRGHSVYNGHYYQSQTLSLYLLQTPQ